MPANAFPGDSTGSSLRRAAISWDSETVEDFDERCAQIPVEEFQTLIGGREVLSNVNRRLRSFRATGLKSLRDGGRSAEYRPLCDIFNSVESMADSGYEWKVVANHAESTSITHCPTLARYPKDIQLARKAFSRRMGKDPDIARCAWAWMSSFVEVKNEPQRSGFYFKERDSKEAPLFLRLTQDGKIARAQTVKHVEEAMMRQHRTHYYSIYISQMSARVFRWDRAGCLATEPIDLDTEYKVFMRLLYRLATAHDNYGLDSTVALAADADILKLRQYEPDNNELQKHRDRMLHDIERHPIYKVTCPVVSLSEDAIEKTYLLGRVATDLYSLFGRCTRGYVAFELEGNRMVWLKDQWRAVSRPRSELDAYMRLHKHSVTHIATPIAGGDVTGQCTVSQHYRRYFPAGRGPSGHIHTRLVTREVGRSLETYRDSPELLQVCLHAFTAHQEAYHRARVLHGDISTGNIMINVESGQGFLNDWDLCMYLEDLEAPEATFQSLGTWAFKSVFSLEYPMKPPELADDLESFVHVITFLAFRYHLHALSPVASNSDSVAVQRQAAAANFGFMGWITTVFFEKRAAGRGYYVGGTMKRTFIDMGHSPCFLHPLPNGRQPLIKLFLDKACLLLRAHYLATDDSRYAQYSIPSPRATPAMRAAAQPSRDPQDSPSAPPPYPTKMPNIPPEWLESSDEEDTPFADQPCKTAQVNSGDPSAPTGSDAQRPRRPLDDHEALGSLFRSVVLDKHDNVRNFTGLRDDKRYDQFHHMKYDDPSQESAHNTDIRDDSVPSQISRKKRRRMDEDEEQARAEEPPKKVVRGGKNVKASVTSRTKAAPSRAQKVTSATKLKAVPKSEARVSKTTTKAATSRRRTNTQDARAESVKAARRGRASENIAEPRRSRRLAALRD